MFFRGSRYENIAEADIVDRNGRTIRYKRMRFIPDIRGTLASGIRNFIGGCATSTRSAGQPG
jgi:hypothetical protein